LAPCRISCRWTRRSPPLLLSRPRLRVPCLFGPLECWVVRDRGRGKERWKGGEEETGMGLFMFRLERVINRLGSKPASI
jgi:hypothetical protein